MAGENQSVFSLSSSIELDQNVGILDAVDVVDVVSCTPGPPPKLLLIDGDEEGLQTRNSSTSGPSTSVISGSSDRNGSPVSTLSMNESQKRYFCQRCLNHRLEFPRKGHKPFCKYTHCQCNDCIMVEKRRQLNNRLSQRRLDPNAPRPEPGAKKIRNPKCARCSAHGKSQALRGHKRVQCPYDKCTCERCEWVRERRTLMAKQIKLRRDQSKARKAQQVVDNIEQIVRATTKFDDIVSFDFKSKKSAKKPKTQKQKTSKFNQQPHFMESTQLLKSQIEARQQEADRNDENRGFGHQHVAMPLPLYPPHFFRYFNTGPLPIHFPVPPYPPPLNFITQQKARSSETISTLASNSSSLPSPTTPSHSQPQVNNNLSPPSNDLAIDDQDSSKSSPRTGLPSLQLLQQQLLAMTGPLVTNAGPDLFDANRMQKHCEEVLSTMRKQLIVSQQQQTDFLSSSSTIMPSQGFVIAPEILRQMSTNPGVAQHWRQLIQQQTTPNNPVRMINEQEQPDMIPITIYTTPIRMILSKNIMD